MTKKMYLDELTRKLLSIDQPMREAILQQYEGLFQEGFKSNKTDVEIISDLGSTDFVSDYYLKELKARESNTATKTTTTSTTQKNTQPLGVVFIRGLFVGFGLLLFNLVIVLGPYVALWGLIIAFFATGFSLSLSAIVIAIASLVTLPFAVSLPTIFLGHPVLLIALCAILISLGFIFMLSTLFLCKYLALWTCQYVKWNISVIRGDNND